MIHAYVWVLSVCCSSVCCCCCDSSALITAKIRQFNNDVYTVYTVMFGCCQSAACQSAAAVATRHPLLRLRLITTFAVYTVVHPHALKRGPITCSIFHTNEFIASTLCEHLVQTTDAMSSSLRLERLSSTGIHTAYAMIHS